MSRAPGPRRRLSPTSSPGPTTGLETLLAGLGGLEPQRSCSPQIASRGTFAHWGAVVHLIKGPEARMYYSECPRGLADLHVSAGVGHILHMRGGPGSCRGRPGGRHVRRSPRRAADRRARLRLRAGRSRRGRGERSVSRRSTTYSTHPSHRRRHRRLIGRAGPLAGPASEQPPPPHRWG